MSMTTLPDGKRVWLVHDLRSRIGIGDGVKTVCSGRGTGEVDREGGAESAGVSISCVFSELWYSMIPTIFSGCLLEEMIVVTPAAVAISAAMILVSIPPVPRLDPRVVVLTGIVRSGQGDNIGTNLSLE